MILKTLQVENFRQITGKFRVTFAAPGSRNVTVVLGENGAGKSTLLNAFRWCLYGSIEMENPEDILSHHATYCAAVGDRLRVQVELHFEHNGSDYKILRVREYRKVEGGAAEPVGEQVFEVTRIGSDGVPRTIQDPEGVVLNLLPENLSRFFFFQGESILQLALQRSRQALREGVESLLDFEVIDRAIRHLKVVESDFERELKQVAGGSIKELQDAIDQLKSDIDGLKEQQQQIVRNINSNLTATEDIKRRLAEVDQFRPVLQEMHTQEVRLTQLNKERQGFLKELCETISEDGYLLFAGEILRIPSELAAKAVERGELPAKIKPHFVDDLLERGTCICGLSINHAMADALNGWKAKIGLAELEQGIAALRQGTAEFTRRRDQSKARIQQLRAKIAEADENIRVATEKKSAAQRQLGKINLTETHINDLRDKLETQTNELVDHRVQQARNIDAIRAKEEELAKKEKERTELVKTQKKEGLVGRRIDATRNVRQALDKIREVWSTLVQTYLDAQLKQSWEEVAQLPRRVSFNAEFALTIEERGGAGDWITSAPSEANCAVLALTFVAALIRFAHEISKDKERATRVFAGGEYPLVMDAPFAKMDTDFKMKVPRGLAEAVPQIVLISSLDQWHDEVESVIGRAVGKAYVLTLHKPGKADDVRNVRAFGRSVPYVVTDRDGYRDWSVIEEVRQ